MAGYTKLFSDIVESSIWQEPSDVRVVWLTMLALSDADGYVRGSPGWLASKAKVELRTCIDALQKFQEPDPSSRTPDNDGRRIEQLSDGWLILNYLAFRDRLSNDATAASTRERVRRHRERYRALRNVTSVTGGVSASASASDSVREGCGERVASELPDFDQAFAATANKAIPCDFCRYVYDDWSTRQGKDAAGNLVEWLPYVSKRWTREQVEWQSGKHKGRPQSTVRRNCVTGEPDPV